jgi:hypothetical protein
VKLWSLPRSILVAFVLLNVYLAVSFAWFYFEKSRAPVETIALPLPPTFRHREPIRCSFDRALMTGVGTTMSCLVAPEISVQIEFEGEMALLAGVTAAETEQNHSNFSFLITPRYAGSAELLFKTWEIGDRPSGVGNPPEPYSSLVTVNVQNGWGEILTKTAYYFASFSACYLLILLITRAVRTRAQQVASTEQKVAAAEDNAERQPEKARYAWDLARVKLEAYFDRNLSQVNQVFWLAATVMSIGFAFVLGAVFMSLHAPSITPTSKVAAISGIITQIIGATFLVIYRSTMTQANEFMAVLERINTVGMATQVLDSIPDEQFELKNATRAEIVSLLLGASARMRQGPERTRSVTPKERGLAAKQT